MGLLKSVAAETLMSILLSPVMMLIQSRFVLDVLLGRDSGWNAQNRDEEALPFHVPARRHLGHVLAGLAFGILAFLISWATFFWFLPIMAGLISAPLMSWATGLPAAGRWLFAANVFRIPEEQETTETGDAALDPVTVLQAAE